MEIIIVRNVGMGINENGFTLLILFGITMECSVCMESIECPTKAPCGHAFHFECLFRWGRQHNSCPLCRGQLIKIEEEEIPPLLWAPRYGRSSIMDILTGQPQTLRQNITREIERRYRARPIEEYRDQELDPLDVQLVMEQTGVSQRKAEVFLKYFERDIVDTIMFLTMSRDGELAIPEYRNRGLPAPTEPYVPRVHKHRMIYEGRATGYESS
jgi:NACalpha-BTF3-like transcription factor